MTIIKIGGSVLTYKNKTGVPAFRRKTAQQLASELAIFLKHAEEDFILVHGAGSFGHPLAQKYGLAQLNRVKNKSRTFWRGIIPRQKVRDKDKIGACSTHYSVQRLNLLTAEVFLSQRCPIFCLSPAAFITQSRGIITIFNKKPLELLLKQGIIPLLRGDVVLDEKSRFSICSGDQIVSYLSHMFKPKQVLFLSDVDGIMTDDPRINPTATLLKKIPRTQLARLISKMEISAGADVTGAMKGKLLEIAKIKCPVQVFNGLKKGNFLRALKGEIVGTKIF